MRFAALLLTCVVAAGCAGTSDDNVGSGEQFATGSDCRVMFEDEDFILLRTQTGERLIVSKRLHVVDVRMTQAQRGSDAMKGTRFWDSHLEYVFAPRVSEESLMKVGNMLGEQMPNAPITLNSDSAAVETSMQPSSARYTNVGENLIADLGDATNGASPVLNGAMRRSFLTNARVSATAACGNGQIPIVLEAARPAVFEVDKAKLFQPNSDLVAIDTFLATANAIRNGENYRENLTKVGPEVAAKMTAFAELVERDIRPLANSYGATATRADLQRKVQSTWTAYLELAGTVLKATNATVGVDQMFVRNGDGSYGMSTETPPLANDLLPGANTVHRTVDTVLAERGAMWTERALQP